MGLNLSFKGYTYDENENKIDCKYQVHYVRQDVWNNVRDTDSQYFSCNAGDEDSLDQTGEVKAGDVIILTFWQGDGSGGDTVDNRDNLFDRFAAHVIIHDGTTESYELDVMLKPKLAPNISWYLSSARTINRKIYAYNYSTDKSSWDYNGNTFVHDYSLYNKVIFPKVNQLTTTYDWDDDNDDVDGYEDTANHSYTAIGDYTPKIKVKNAWDLVSDDEKTIRIKYNKPIGKIVFDPDGVVNKIHTTEDASISADITDEDGRITNIEHHWVVKDRDSGDEISNEKVDENTTLDYSYNKTIEVLQKHYGEQIIYWNDGYDDLSFIYTKELVITNWLPLVNFKFKFLNDTKVRFTPICSDIDGEVVEYTWKLYSLIPFTDGDYALSKTIINPDDANVDIDFDTAGHFKMVLTAKDDTDGTATFAAEFDVTGTDSCVSGELLESDMCFIIPDKYKF